MCFNYKLIIFEGKEAYFLPYLKPQKNKTERDLNLIGS